MSRIDERLEIMGVDTSEMTTEEKFTAATGLTRYDEEMAANDWYVPAGAANTPDEVSEESGEQGQTSQVEPTGEQTGSTEPTGEQTGSTEPTGEQTGSTEPTGEQTGSTEPTGEQTGSTEPTGEQTGSTEPTGEQTGSTEPTGEQTGSTEPTGEQTGSTEPTGEQTGSTEPTGEPSTVDVETGESGETSEPTGEYWYLGLTQPTDNTVITDELTENVNSLGWHFIGSTLGTYSATNPLNQNTETFILDEDYNDVTYYIALPGSLKVYDGLGGVVGYDNLGTSTIGGVQYAIYQGLGSEFGFKIY